MRNDLLILGIVGLVGIILVIYAEPLRAAYGRAAVRLRNRPTPIRPPVPATGVVAQPAPPPRPPKPQALPRAADPVLTAHADAVTALVATTYTVLRAIPPQFWEHTTMRAEAMAAEHDLAQLRARLPGAEPVTYPSLDQALGRIERRLRSIEQSARTVVTTAERLDTLSTQLRTAADAFQADLTRYEQQDFYPLLWDGDSLNGRAILPAIAPMLDEQVNSHDSLKRLTLRLRGALDSLGAGQAAVAQALERRDTLLTLLAQPALALDPPWHRPIALLGQRHDPTLQAEADGLLQRRRMLLAGCEPAGAGSVRLPECRLEELLAETEQLQRAIVNCWQRARTLAAKRRDA